MSIKEQIKDSSALLMLYGIIEIMFKVAREQKINDEVIKANIEMTIKQFVEEILKSNKL